MAPILVSLLGGSSLPIANTKAKKVLVKGELYGEPVLLGNVYAPNVYDEDFFAFLISKIPEMDCTNMTIGVGFYMVMKMMMETATRQVPGRPGQRNGRDGRRGQAIQAVPAPAPPHRLVVLPWVASPSRLVVVVVPSGSSRAVFAAVAHVRAVGPVQHSLAAVAAVRAVLAVQGPLAAVAAVGAVVSV
ncbi:unnamed protein product [Menidia menidia]|uniref:(Atlantic silverside) hypothetical protein n=1 Tax=Menidia menidia TaxID=238744 RepID=A0A8S4ASN9_9TELE|nr:unnamed protein product [Menidia menidia]